MSEAKLAISEIGVVDPDESWGKESRFGNPFTVSLKTKKLKLPKINKLYPTAKAE